MEWPRLYSPDSEQVASAYHRHKIYIYIWVFPKIGVPQNGWFIRETPIKMDDLGLPLFSETPIYSERVGYWEHGSTIPTQLTLEPLKPTGVERFTHRMFMMSVKHVQCVWNAKVKSHMKSIKSIIWWIWCRGFVTFLTSLFGATSTLQISTRVSPCTYWNCMGPFCEGMTMLARCCEHPEIISSFDHIWIYLISFYVRVFICSD